MYKNVANQKLAIYAHDTQNDAAKTGDAGNITAYISKDGGAAAQTDDINPTELDAVNMPGAYIFNMLQAETNCDLLMLAAQSATEGVQIEPVVIYTLNDPAASEIALAVGQRQIPDSYSADGAQPTIEQAILAIHQFLQERAVSDTTVTVKKPDGTTTAMTFTLDDAVNPTSITRTG